jgi:hypothetical protein
MNPTRALRRIAAAGVFAAMLFPTAAFGMEGVTQSDDPDLMTITAVTEDSPASDTAVSSEDSSVYETTVTSEDSGEVILEDGTVGGSDDVRRTTAEELMSTTGLPVSQESGSQGALAVGAIAVAAAVAFGFVAVRRRSAAND